MGQEPSGKARGGVARAEKLSPKERKEIAKKGAQARWKKQLEPGTSKATHIGILHVGDIQIPCAVLEGGVRVVSERSIAIALGKKGGGAYWKKKKQAEGAILPEYISAKNLVPYISEETKVKLINSIPYISKSGGLANGIPAIILQEICEIWLRARDSGALTEQQRETALKAEILMRGFARVGIIALVDEATGYQAERDKDGLQKFLALYLSEERLKWAKMFPDEYYKQLFRLRGWTYSPMSVKRPKLVGKLTNQLVYKKLPANVIEDLRRLNPVKNKKTWRREATHVQHLSKDIGQKDLRDHLLQLITVMRVSRNWDAFKRNFAQAFPTPGTQIEMFDESDED